MSSFHRERLKLRELRKSLKLRSFWTPSLRKERVFLKSENWPMWLRVILRFFEMTRISTRSTLVLCYRIAILRGIFSIMMNLCLNLIRRIEALKRVTF